jgi:hypothetical protein
MDRRPVGRISFLIASSWILLYGVVSEPSHARFSSYQCGPAVIVIFNCATARLVTGISGLRLQKVLRQNWELSKLFRFELLPVFRHHLYNITSLAKTGEQRIVEHICLVLFAGFMGRDIQVQQVHQSEVT